VFERAFRESVDGVHTLRREDLRLAGLSLRQIRAAVAGGALLRPREGSYLPAGTPVDLVDACRIAGRLACVSELHRQGVFVMDATVLHVHLAATTGRVRRIGRPVRTHWGRLRRTPHPRATSVELLDALIQAVRCQQPRASIATLDSALHRGLLRPDDLDELFDALPRRYRRLRPLLDPRSESGPETLIRLMLRALGLSFEVQVTIDGVGRVDLLVEGWLIIECDSRAHHSDWASQRRDRRRDQAAAALGLSTFRPIAEDIMWRPDEVRAALSGLVTARRRHGANQIQEKRLRRIL
jgi:very-short-patch-repair endonuclease